MSGGCYARRPTFRDRRAVRGRLPHARTAAAQLRYANGPLPAVRVHVSNHYKTEMEIYATGSGTTQRLGLVAPGLEREFDVPQLMVVAGSVTFTAHPSGVGPMVRSEEIRIRPGDLVDFEIATNLVGSQAWVRCKRPGLRASGKGARATEAQGDPLDLHAVPPGATVTPSSRRSEICSRSTRSSRGRSPSRRGPPRVPPSSSTRPGNPCGSSTPPEVKAASGTARSLHVLSTGTAAVQLVPSSSISVRCSDLPGPEAAQPERAPRRRRRSSPAAPGSGPRSTSDAV